MAQPPAYLRGTQFALEERDNTGGRSTVRTAALDGELDALSVTVNAIRSVIALNQRDDGEIRDGRVKLFTLATDVLALLVAQGGATVRGAWATATPYVVKDVVTQGGNTYICAVAHTSGTFATDLAAVKWLLLALGSVPTASTIPFSPTATLAATTVQTAIDEADTENRALTAAILARLLSTVLNTDGAGMVGYSDSLTYPGGSVGAKLQSAAVVNFVQGGGTPATRLMQTKVREISVSIMDFVGADPTGTTASDAAFAAAYNYLATLGAGGGFLDVPIGTYLLATPHTIPTCVIVRGIGKRRSTLLRGHGSDMFTMNSYSGFRDLTIDGNTSVYGGGKGIIFPTNRPGQVMFNVEVRRFNTSCLEFASDGGSGFKSYAGDYNTTGSVGIVAAVKVNGTDTQAIPRHFYGTESGGCTLFDFGGANNFFVTGGYSSGLIFGPTSSKVELTNFRIGYSTGFTFIKGNSHSLIGIAFAEYVSIDSAATAIQFDCVVPDNLVLDNGTGNYVTLQGMPTYGCVWGADGTAPVLGNGTLAANYTRRGQMVEVTINLVAGSTTTFGTGDLTFTLPKLDNASLTQVACGQAWITNGAGSSAAMGTVWIVPGGGKAKVNVINGGAAANLQGTVPFALNAGSVIRMRFFYQTV